MIVTAASNITKVTLCVRMRQEKGRSLTTNHRDFSWCLFREHGIGKTDFKSNRPTNIIAAIVIKKEL
jgi:hypothetical protein